MEYWLAEAEEWGAAQRMDGARMNGEPFQEKDLHGVRKLGRLFDRNQRRFQVGEAAEWMSSAALVMETVRLNFHNRHFSALGSHETMAVLCTQYMMMEVRYPLSAGNRHIQIPYSVVEMH